MQKSRRRLNRVKDRMIFLSPTVTLGKENEARLKDFKTLIILGKGAFGQVYKVQHKVSKREFALKVVSKDLIAKYQMEKQIENEVRIMYSLTHPNIITLYNHFEDNDNIYLILELSEQGQLYSKLKEKKRLDEKTAAKYLADLVSGLEFMHTRDPPIIHRDIKPENLLITASGDLKLADFGWSNFGQEESRRNTFCGTPEYIAPEMVSELGHTEKLDIWAIGIILYELLVGTTPFVPQKTSGNSDFALNSNILEAKVKYPSDYPAIARDLTQKLLKINPNERMSIKQIKRHPWFKQFKLFDQEQVDIRNERMRNSEHEGLVKLEEFDKSDFFNNGKVKTLSVEEAVRFSKRGSLLNSQYSLFDNNNEGGATKYQNQGEEARIKKNEKIKLLFDQLRDREAELRRLERQVQGENDRQRRLELEIDEIKTKANISSEGGIILSSLELKKFKLQELDKDNLKNKYQELWERFISKEREKDNLRGKRNRMEEVKLINKRLKLEKEDIYNQINQVERQLGDLRDLESKYQEEQQSKIGQLNEKIDYYKQKVSINSTDDNDRIIENLKSYKLQVHEDLKESINSYIKHQEITQKMKNEVDQAKFKLRKYDISNEKKFNDEVEIIKEEYESTLREMRKKHRNKMHNLYLEADSLQLEYIKKIHIEKIKKQMVSSRNHASSLSSELNQIEAESYSTTNLTISSQQTALESKDQQMKLLQDQIDELLNQEKKLKGQMDALTRKLLNYQNN